jgi:2-methylcitrate dehydratase PrpD
MADIMSHLVKHIIGAKYEDLTTEAIDSAKKSILDTIAITIAGSTAERCKAIVDLVKDWGGKEESTIWIYGGKVPATLAGLAIGPMARARDFGDVCEMKNSPHVTEYILPVAFPTAERQGGINGKDFISAIALGQDLAIRFESSITMHPDCTHPAYGMSSIFGPTAVVARLLRLNEEAAWNAMGLAYNQAVGEMQGYVDGAFSVRMQHGFVADAAIKAGLLAQRGITGAKNILQGKFSFYRTFASEHNLELLTCELGRRFEGAYLSLKLYPACKRTHGAINATIEMATEYDIKPQEVKEIDVGVGVKTYQFVCEPREIKYNPRNVVDCQFSLPYTVATAIVKRDVFLEDFTEEAIKRPDVLEIMSRVKTRVDPEVLTDSSLIPDGVRVTIRTKDGKEYSKRVYEVKGHPNNPMTMGDVIEKFRRCLPFSAYPLPEENTEEIIKMVSNLEDVDDVTQIVELLVP